MRFLGVSWGRSDVSVALTAFNKTTKNREDRDRYRDRDRDREANTR